MKNDYYNIRKVTFLELNTEERREAIKEIVDENKITPEFFPRNITASQLQKMISKGEMNPDDYYQFWLLNTGLCPLRNKNPVNKELNEILEEISKWSGVSTLLNKYSIKKEWEKFFKEIEDYKTKEVLEKVAQYKNVIEKHICIPEYSPEQS